MHFNEARATVQESIRWMEKYSRTNENKVRESLRLGNIVLQQREKQEAKELLTKAAEL